MISVAEIADRTAYRMDGTAAKLNCQLINTKCLCFHLEFRSISYSSKEILYNVIFSLHLKFVILECQNFAAH